MFLCTLSPLCCNFSDYKSNPSVCWAILLSICFWATRIQDTLMYHFPVTACCFITVIIWNALFQSIQFSISAFPAFCIRILHKHNVILLNKVQWFLMFSGFFGEWASMLAHTFNPDVSEAKNQLFGHFGLDVTIAASNQARNCGRVLPAKVARGAIGEAWVGWSRGSQCGGQARGRKGGWRVCPHVDSVLWSGCDRSLNATPRQEATPFEFINELRIRTYQL